MPLTPPSAWPMAPAPPADGAAARSAQDDSAEVVLGPRLPLVPASVAKLATSHFALERLGSGFTFKTRILAEGEIQGEVLHGDLIVKGGGDPFLVSERLWLLVHQIQALGLRRVAGRLILDASLLDPPEQDPYRVQEREKGERAYAARLSAFPVNFNAAAVRVAPGAKAGDPGTVTADPLPCSYIRIENRLTTSPKGGEPACTVKLTPDSLRERLVVEGTIPEGSEGEVIYRSVSDPDRFAVSLFRAFLGEAGIKVDGPDLVEARPASRGAAASRKKPEAPQAPHAKAHLLVEFASLPLGTLLGQMNHYSNNLMADQICMIEADTARANLTAGASALTAWLREKTGSAEIIMHDGSGLNPVDRLTGEVLMQILRRAWWDLRIQPDLLASLPVPGEDGTLRRRFRGGLLPLLRAKTGTMADPSASGIAGYLQHPRYGPVAFAVLMNARGPAAWPTAKMQETQENWIGEYLRGDEPAGPSK
jgi:serine-type D-Ala-D-Ala carboxypeptidase/endopeptidase (penicillin-binding protein 4)